MVALLQWFCSASGPVGVGLGVSVGVNGVFVGDVKPASSSPSITIGVIEGVGVFVGRFTGPISIILFVDGRYKIARFAPTKIKTLSPFCALAKNG